MPLVFLHGIKTREGGEYLSKTQARDELFRTAFAGRATDPGDFRVFNPYWGEFGANFTWGHAYRPEGAYEAFGGAGDLFAEIVDEQAPAVEFEPDHVLITTAREGSLGDAVNALWSAAAFVISAEPDPARRPAPAADLAALGAEAARYAAEFPEPDWLRDVPNDRAFVEILVDQVNAWAATDEVAVEHFGSGAFSLKALLSAAGKLAAAAAGLTKSGLRSAAVLARTVGVAVRDGALAAGDAVKDAAVAAGAGALHTSLRSGSYIVAPVASALNSWFHNAVAEGVGDILVYVNARGSRSAPGDIIKTVVADFEAAARAATTSDPVVVVGHSLGGVIAYDVLSHFLPDYPCATLVTVGSQVAVFAELNLFRSSLSGPKPPLAPPPNIHRWINLFDRKDPLGYSVRKVFTEVEDYEFSTRTNTLLAHTEYFTKPRFFQRLKEHLEN